jgi:hypothetical protein
VAGNGFEAFTSPMTTVLEVAVPQCAAEVLEDEVVTLNVETGIYFSMRGLSSVLWQDLAAGHPVEMLAANADDAARVSAFAEQLIRYGLMRPGAARPLAGEPASRELFSDGSAEIVFEVYEDMQDLILSDPIHDVDETRGWPAPRAERA